MITLLYVGGLDVLVFNNCHEKVGRTLERSKFKLVTFCSLIIVLTGCVRQMINIKLHITTISYHISKHTIISAGLQLK